MSFKHRTSASSLGCCEPLSVQSSEAALALSFKRHIQPPGQVLVYIPVDVLGDCPNTTGLGSCAGSLELYG
jgi:hypothetical protein